MKNVKDQKSFFKSKNVIFIFKAFHNLLVVTFETCEKPFDWFRYILNRELYETSDNITTNRIFFVALSNKILFTSFLTGKRNNAVVLKGFTRCSWNIA